LVLQLLQSSRRRFEKTRDGAGAMIGTADGLAIIGVIVTVGLARGEVRAVTMGAAVVVVVVVVAVVAGAETLVPPVITLAGMMETQWISMRDN